MTSHLLDTQPLQDQIGDYSYNSELVIPLNCSNQSRQTNMPFAYKPAKIPTPFSLSLTTEALEG